MPSTKLAAESTGAVATTLVAVVTFPDTLPVRLPVKFPENVPAYNVFVLGT